MGALSEMAARLEQVRQDSGLSQEAFSKRLGISRGAFQHYVKGAHDIPTSVIAALKREFDVDPYWMVCGNDAGPSTEKEMSLVRNAVIISVILQRAYARRNVDWDVDKLVKAVQFAEFYLVDGRTDLTEFDEVINRYAET